MSCNISKSIAIIVLNAFFITQLCFAVEKNGDCPNPNSLLTFEGTVTIFFQDDCLKWPSQGVCSQGRSACSSGRPHSAKIFVSLTSFGNQATKIFVRPAHRHPSWPPHQADLQTAEIFCHALRPEGGSGRGAAAAGEELQRTAAPASGGTVKEIFQNPEFSQKIAEELCKGRVDTFCSLLSDALSKDQLRIDNYDFGAAVTWLIENFPLEKKEGKFVGDEFEYELVRSVIGLYLIIKEMQGVDLPNKLLLVNRVMPLLYTRGRGMYDDLTPRIKSANLAMEKAARELLLDEIPLPILKKILYSIESIISVSLVKDETLAKIDDVELMGQAAVDMANRQGWYISTKSFMSHQIKWGISELKGFWKGLVGN